MVVVATGKFNVKSNLVIIIFFSLCLTEDNLIVVL